MHKILLVDDEIDILKFVELILEDKLHCEIQTAMNGLDAYLMATKVKYDLILTDFKMPFMNGAALVIAIRTKENLNKSTPIIMLSAFIDNDLRKSLAIQNIEFLEKPVNSQDLIKSVQGNLI
jgi:YesN/AraC family two-component response regulator